MPVYAIQQNDHLQKFEPVKRKEASVHSLFEANLNELLGLRVLSREYTLQDGDRIDTLAVDEDQRPVIVEYKVGEADNSIYAQVVNYKILLKKQKKLLSLEIKEEHDIDLDWSGELTVILVAQSFDKKMHVIAGDGGVKLVKYSFHELGEVQILILEEEETSAAKLAKKKPLTPAQPTIPALPSVPASISRYLDMTKPEFRAPYAALRDQVLELDGIEEVVLPKIGITYKTLKAVVRFEFRKNSIDLVLKAGAESGDSLHRMRDVTRHLWGFPWLFKIETPADFSYAWQLIRAAYEAAR